MELSLCGGRWSGERYGGLGKCKKVKWLLLHPRQFGSGIDQERVGSGSGGAAARRAGQPEGPTIDQGSRSGLRFGSFPIGCRAEACRTSSEGSKGRERSV